MMKPLVVALQAAQLGGEVIRSSFRRPPEVTWKGPADPVTATDVQVEELIVETIRSAFPDDSFLAEERHHADLDAEHLWVIDPLDGTQNYARGIPFFSVSIALAQRGHAVLAVLHDPLRCESICAEVHGGTRCNGEPVSLCPTRLLEDAVVSIGVLSARRPQNPHLTLPTLQALYPQIGWTRSLGSTALELAYVACGRVDIVFQDRLNPWDLLAGALLVQEAGGIATDMQGQPISTHSRSVLAAAQPEFHATALRLAQSLDRD